MIWLSPTSWSRETEHGRYYIECSGGWHATRNGRKERRAKDLGWHDSAEAAIDACMVDMESWIDQYPEALI